MRLLHTMLRVGDLEASIKFYCEILGMDLLRRNDYPDGRFTLAFLGYGIESENTVLELTHNWDIQEYDLGNAYGHIAIAVEDVYAALVMGNGFSGKGKKGGFGDVWLLSEKFPSCDTCVWLFAHHEKKKSVV